MTASLITPAEVSSIAFVNALDPELILPMFISSAQTKYIVPLVTQPVIDKIATTPGDYTVLVHDYIKTYLAFSVKYMFYNQLLTETDKFPTSDAQRTAAIQEVLTIMEVSRGLLSDYLNANIFETPVVPVKNLTAGFLKSKGQLSTGNSNSDVTSILANTSTGIPSDPDTFNFFSFATGLLNKITWSNLKIALKSYFDLLYPGINNVIAGNIIEPPQLKLDSGNYATVYHSFHFLDTLRCYWDSSNKAFLNYNPEVWVFRKRNYDRRSKTKNTTYGSNLVSHGAFEAGDASHWNCDANVVISGGKLNFIAAADGSTANLADVLDLVTWKNYEISFEVTNHSSGYVYFDMHGEGSVQATFNGTWSNIIRCNNQSSGLKFVCQGTSTFSIDNLVIREVVYNRVNIKHKKWTHEPHLNGVKYPVSKYFSGAMQSEECPIASVGRHTEFPLTALKNNDKMVIPLDPFEYYFGDNHSGPLAVIDEHFDYETYDPVILGRDGLLITFRFAIVVDNPDSEADCPKLIGQLSDPVTMIMTAKRNNVKIQPFIRFCNKYN